MSNIDMIRAFDRLLRAVEIDGGLRDAAAQARKDFAAALASQPVTQSVEPVAWIVRKDCDELYHSESAARSYAGIIGADVIPLYTRPMAATPDKATKLMHEAVKLSYNCFQSFVSSDPAWNSMQNKAKAACVAALAAPQPSVSQEAGK